MQPSPSNRFLDRFEGARRGAVNVFFLTPARRKPDALPAALVVQVLESCSTRGDRWDVMTAIEQHPQEALEMAAFSLAWDKLPEAERHARQAEATKVGIDTHMATLPPTEKQLALLRSKGRHVVPKTRLDASRLIDELLGGSGGQR